MHQQCIGEWIDFAHRSGVKTERPMHRTERNTELTGARYDGNDSTPPLSRSAGTAAALRPSSDVPWTRYNRTALRSEHTPVHQVFTVAPTPPKDTQKEDQKGIVRFT